MRIALRDFLYLALVCDVSDQGKERPKKTNGLSLPWTIFIVNENWIKQISQRYFRCILNGYFVAFQRLLTVLICQPRKTENSCESWKKVMRKIRDIPSLNRNVRCGP